jgi:hypothetical protein
LFLREPAVLILDLIGLHPGMREHMVDIDAIVISLDESQVAGNYLAVI